MPAQLGRGGDELAVPRGGAPVGEHGCVLEAGSDAVASRCGAPVYKLLKGDTVRGPSSLGNKEVLAKHLKAKKAVLVRKQPVGSK